MGVEESMKNKGVLAVLAAAFLVFFARAFFFLDPDLGWHLKMGEIITQEGMPLADRFSYTMPSFEFIYLEWLMGLTAYKLYGVWGKTGIALTEALVLTGIIGLLMQEGRGSGGKEKKVKYGKAGFWLLGLAAFLYYARVFFQLTTLIFITWLVRSIVREKRWKKVRRFAPLLFLVWANTHGGFALGLVTMGVILGFRALKAKRWDGADGWLLTASVFATLLNPFGVKAWQEVFRVVTSTAMMGAVQEWKPPIYQVNTALPFWVGFCLVMGLRFRKRFTWEEKVIFWFYFLLGLTAQRHVALWVLASMVLLSHVWEYFYQEIRGDKEKVIRFISLQKAFLGFSLVVFGWQACQVIGNAVLVSEERFYPREAVAFLKRNLPEGEIFSGYGWGGYLIWKLPQKKVFVDGRMPSWRCAPPVGESAAAFAEALAVVSGKAEMGEVFTKYEVDMVLWPVVKYKTRLSLRDRLELKLNKMLKFEDRENNDEFLQRLEREGFIKIYEDETAVLYKKFTS